MGKRCESAYDIVSSLPLELLLEIVEYLEPADIVRSRRVRIFPFFDKKKKKK